MNPQKAWIGDETTVASLEQWFSTTDVSRTPSGLTVVMRAPSSRGGGVVLDGYSDKGVNKKTACVQTNFEALKRIVFNPTHLAHMVWSI